MKLFQSMAEIYVYEFLIWVCEYTIAWSVVAAN